MANLAIISAQSFSSAFSAKICCMDDKLRVTCDFSAARTDPRFQSVQPVADQIATRQSDFERLGRIRYLTNTPWSKEAILRLKTIDFKSSIRSRT